MAMTTSKRKEATLLASILSLMLTTASPKSSSIIMNLFLFHQLSDETDAICYLDTYINIFDKILNE